MNQLRDLQKQNEEAMRAYQMEIDRLRQQIESMGVRDTRERPEIPAIITFKPPLSTSNKIKVLTGFPHENFDEFQLQIAQAMDGYDGSNQAKIGFIISYLSGVAETYANRLTTVQPTITMETSLKIYKQNFMFHSTRRAQKRSSEKGRSCPRRASRNILWIWRYF